MKKSLNYIFLFVLLCIISCKKDCQSFETYKVDFFIDHEEFQIVEPIFETVTEQKLVKQASYSTGTVFKTVTEEVLLQEGFTQRAIYDTQDISLVINAETNTIQNVSCYDFFDSDEFVEIEIPNTYTTRSYQVVDKEGTGIALPA